MATVVVVDDEPDIRYLTQLTLEMDGHRVMTAADGDEALAAVQVEIPDLVLLDVMMPGLSGWDVLEKLKAHLDEDIASVKVLVMTALGGDTDRIRGGIEGAVRYLVKPVSPDDLCAAVREVLQDVPERAQRLRAQTDALIELAQLEAGAHGRAGVAPGPRLSRLEHRRARDRDDDPQRIDITEALTDKQHELVRAILASPSVSEAAGRLGVSRSNVYASLRRIARRLDIESVPVLLGRLRTGVYTLVDG
jgi:two-component system phosphate regulon response regulator PhoB